MGGINRGRPATHRSGGYCVCSGHIRRTVLTCFLVWASSVALIFITAVGASSPSGDSFVHAHGPADIEEHPSTRVNPSISINITEEPICWETEGPHERDCFHAEPLTAETYPLTREMLERASSRYTTTGLSLQRAFQRARKRGMLKVVVLGGSVTYGHGCASPAGLDGMDCAWPQRLQQWCDEHIEDFVVEVVNAATPGFNIGNFLHNNLRSTLPLDSDVDLIIVDYGVNDAISEQFEFDLSNVKFAHEILISHVQNDMIHMPALLYAEGYISPARLRSVPLQGGNMAEVHAAVTRKYDIPMVSFRDAVWPDEEDSALADRLWGSGVHPNWQTQQLLADVLVYFIEKAYARFLEEHGPLSSPSPREESLLLFTSKMGCLADERSFVLDATAFVGRPPPEQQVESVGWSFSQDQRGNSGLIGFGSSESKATVSFELPCGGPRRVLDIGYLLSYIGMGAAKVVVSRLDPNGGSDKDSKDVDGVVTGKDDSSDDVVVVIDGLWDSRASVQGNEVIPLPDGFDSIRVTFEVLSADTETLYARFLSDSNTRESGNIRRNRKFKVARMQCC